MIYFSFYSNQSGKLKPFQYKTEPLMVSALFPFIAPAAICWCAFTLGCTFRYNVVGSFFPLTSNVLTGACFIHTDSPSNKLTNIQAAAANVARTAVIFPSHSHEPIHFVMPHTHSFQSSCCCRWTALRCASTNDAWLSHFLSGAKTNAYH
ncbi:T. congolense-specific, putative cell surface-expressed gene family [Trypanosoma congolense IL3000]|uniref:T. congolense-specific, putative cell surface-expressed gene family n=1 Tax=Trypanosoma congolense (strain IL3000) TaxID=1068625 RepID=F9WDZ1_TRYCI|nr:T. congolense-specific, putative cell surface-expressed gene family [Trypanosoma congolense IL3000]